MKPLTEYARATPERQAEMLREWARQAAILAPARAALMAHRARGE